MSVEKQLSALFIPTTNAGVQQYRFTNFTTAAFRNKAFNALQLWWDKAATETHPWEVEIDDAQYRRRLVGELDDHSKQADVLIAQMCHMEGALIELVRLKVENKIPLVTEIDDDILHTPSYNPANAVYGQGSRFRKVAIDQFRMSDAMVVSTPYLAEVYSEFCKNIYVVPNSLDFRIWDNLRHKKNKDVIRIGWAGGASHSEDLRIIESVVHKTLAKHPTTVFCFVHGIPDFLRGIDRVEAVYDFTRIDRYPQFLASRGFDIGLAPLVDSAFNRGKSNLRWLEYAGLNVPCVASKVGHFAETITQAEDGLLCESEQDWLDSIDFLISDENARRKMGKAANKKARKEFNTDLTVWKYRDALADIVSRGQVVKLPEVQEVA